MCIRDRVQGEYPTNSLGESYGDLRLSAYVGYQPDLVAARKIGDQQGYISRAEEEALPSGLPAEECPHEFQLSLYDLSLIHIFSREGNKKQEFFSIFCYFFVYCMLHRKT